MNTLIGFLNQASQTWWSYIVPAIWQGSLVALVIVGIVWIGRRWPSPLRHGLLLVALVKLAMPPLLALPTGVFFWLGQPSLATVSSETSATPPEAIIVAVGKREARANFTETPEQPTVGSASSADFGDPRTEADSAFLPPITWRAWLLLLHALGVAAISAWVGSTFFRIRRMIRRAERVTDGPLYESFLGLCQEIGLRRGVRLILSPEPVAPMALGIVRPTVMLAASMVERLQPAEINTLLSHELVHHRRFDLWTNWIQLIVVAVWWFNPMAWLINRALRRTREDCCDDLLLCRKFTTSSAYSDTLMRVASQLSRSVPLGGTLGFAERLHPLGKRMARIMDPSLSRTKGLSGAGIVALLAVGAFVLPGQGLTAEPTGPETRIFGQVVNHDDGKPVVGADVRLLRRGTHTMPLKPIRTATNEIGEFEFNKVEPGQYKIWAFHGNLASRVERYGGRWARDVGYL